MNKFFTGKMKKLYLIKFPRESKVQLSFDWKLTVKNRFSRTPTYIAKEHPEWVRVIEINFANGQGPCCKDYWLSTEELVEFAEGK